MDQVSNVETNLLVVRILGYADDAALLDEEVEVMTKRLTSLADAAKAEADMIVSMKKTVSQHVGRRANIKISKEEASAAQETFTHKCDFCNRKFKSNKAMLLHRDSCVHQYNTTDEVYVVEEIIGAFGWVDAR